MEYYFIDEDGKKRKSKWVECDNCGIGVLKPIRFLNKGKHNFCCRKCVSEYKKKLTNVELQCSFCGTFFKRSISKLSNSKHKIYYCSKECKDASMKRENWNSDIRASLPLHYGNGNGNYSYRRMALDNYPNECEMCGYKEHLEILQVHHIDGNRKNNKLENLMILCPNCHWAITLKYINIDENRKFIENW